MYGAGSGRTVTTAVCLCVCVLLTLTAILCTMTLGSVSTITLHAQRGGEEEVNYGAQKNYINKLGRPLPSIYEFINDEKHGFHVVQQTALLYIASTKKKLQRIALELDQC